MNNSARTKKNKFCSFCKRTNHTRDECYHRKRRYKEKQTRFKSNNTEPHKTLNRGQFSEAHNVRTIKETPRDSNDTKNCEEFNTKRSNEVVKSDKISKTQDINSNLNLKLKIKRLKNKLENLTKENRFLREENLALSLLYFSDTHKTPFIDNWKKDNDDDEKASKTSNKTNNKCEL